MVFLTDLADVLRDAGLTVIEVPGWKTNARPPSTGGFDPLGNLWHHTGAKDANPLSIEDDIEYAEWLAEIGRSDLPAPLCQLSVGRKGQVFVCAAGRGNHAGVARPFGPLPGGDGNEILLGWECQNTGSEGWTPEQYRSMVIGGAATSLHYGWTAAANPGHKETSVTGKWDPGLLNMVQFRGDIAAEMKAIRQRAAKERERAKQAAHDQTLRSELTDATQAAKKAGRTSIAERLRGMRDRIGKPKP